MCETVNDILVFKTNISNEEQLQKISIALDAHTGIARWNVDLKDIDFVLRVKPAAGPLPADAIIELVKEKGHQCQELE
jgi:hypothetical protein